MTPTTRHAGVLLCALALAACSSANDAALPADPTVAVVDTIAPPTTAVPSALASPVSGAPPSASAPSTASTTTVPVPTIEQQVVAAYMAAYDAYHRASEFPDDPELRRALASRWSGEQLEFLTAKLDSRVLNSEALHPNPLIPDDVLVESVVLDDGRATVVVCEVDSWIVVSTSDGSERVVDDAVYVYREQFDLELVDGVWLVAGGLLLEDLSEAGSCGE